MLPDQSLLPVLTEKVSLGLKSKGPPGPHSRAIAPEAIKLAIILNHMPLDRNQWVVG